ncbi:MAG: hypothetical protein HRU38_08195 [Saccharospirillaceae bacterium]|nr:hypothetical protein [Pseudomonadales bacterium]NRB78634.1 hypothetical protein [Saccharospirillaceae bacterium]
MQVNSIVPDNIRYQLEHSLSVIDPLELYINDLLGESGIQPKKCLKQYINKRTIVSNQELDCVDLAPTFVNTLQLLRLNNTLNKSTKLYQSILKQIDVYFLTGRVKNE